MNLKLLIFLLYLTFSDISGISFDSANNSIASDSKSSSLHSNQTELKFTVEKIISTLNNEPEDTAKKDDIAVSTDFVSNGNSQSKRSVIKLPVRHSSVLPRTEHFKRADDSNSLPIAHSNASEASPRLEIYPDSEDTYKYEKIHNNVHQVFNEVLNTHSVKNTNIEHQTPQLEDDEKISLLSSHTDGTLKTHQPENFDNSTESQEKELRRKNMLQVFSQLSRNQTISNKPRKFQQSRNSNALGNIVRSGTLNTTVSNVHPGTTNTSANVTRSGTYNTAANNVQPGISNTPRKIVQLGMSNTIRNNVQPGNSNNISNSLQAGNSNTPANNMLLRTSNVPVNVARSGTSNTPANNVQPGIFNNPPNSSQPGNSPNPLNSSQPRTFNITVNTEQARSTDNAFQMHASNPGKKQFVNPELRHIVERMLSGINDRIAINSPSESVENERTVNSDESQNDENNSETLALESSNIKSLHTNSNALQNSDQISNTHSLGHTFKPNTSHAGVHSVILQQSLPKNYSNNLRIINSLEYPNNAANISQSGFPNNFVNNLQSQNMNNAANIPQSRFPNNFATILQSQNPNNAATIPQSGFPNNFAYIPQSGFPNNFANVLQSQNPFNAANIPQSGFPSNFANIPQSQNQNNALNIPQSGFPNNFDNIPQSGYPNNAANSLQSGFPNYAPNTYPPAYFNTGFSTIPNSVGLRYPNNGYYGSPIMAQPGYSHSFYPSGTGYSNMPYLHPSGTSVGGNIQGNLGYFPTASGLQYSDERVGSILTTLGLNSPRYQNNNHRYNNDPQLSDLIARVVGHVSGQMMQQLAYSVLTRPTQ